MQFKDNGDAYVYDLGSTHGTKINKRAIPPKEYIKLNHSDLLKMGESSRLYVYSFDQQESDEQMEEQIDTNSEQQKTRKERMLKLYEENKAQQETFQK